MENRRIREATPDDAESILSIYAPFITDTAVSYEEVVPSVEEFAERIADITQTHPWLVYTIDDVVVGYAYASKHRGRAAYRFATEVSAYVSPAFHRRGIARALYLRLFEDLRTRGFYTALAGVSLPNAASVAFHESLGFTPVGVYRSIGFKFGKWHDAGWWQLKLKDYVSNP